MWENISNLISLSWGIPLVMQSDLGLRIMEWRIAILLSIIDLIHLQGTIQHQWKFEKDECQGWNMVVLSSNELFSWMIGAPPKPWCLQTCSWHSSNSYWVSLSSHWLSSSLKQFLDSIFIALWWIQERCLCRWSTNAGGLQPTTESWSTSKQGWYSCPARFSSTSQRPVSSWGWWWHWHFSWWSTWAYGF